MNYSFFLTVNKPNSENGEYNTFVKVLKELGKQGTGLQILSENSVLIPLNGTLSVLLSVLKLLRKLSCVYAILPEDTKWYVGTMED